jgi:hypothetical protein
VIQAGRFPNESIGLRRGGTTVQRLADQLREPLPEILERVARLAKMELVVLAPGEMGG